MLAQTPLPVDLPFSVLDYGLTALALIAMVAIVYFFTRLANSQHKVATEAFERMTELLEGLTNATREVGHQLQGVQHEMARVHEEVWRNRELINRGLDRAAKALEIGAEIEDTLEEQDRRRRVNQRQQADVEEWRREKDKK